MVAECTREGSEESYTEAFLHDPKARLFLGSANIRIRRERPSSESSLPISAMFVKLTSWRDQACAFSLVTLAIPVHDEGRFFWLTAVKEQFAPAVRPYMVRVRPAYDCLLHGDVAVLKMCEKRYYERIKHNHYVSRSSSCLTPNRELLPSY